MMRLKRDVYSEVSDAIKNLSEAEFGSFLASFDYFCFKNKNLSEEFPIEFEKFKEDNKRWRAFLREIKFWKQVGVEDMNRRLLQLCLRYIPKGEKFFRIENEIGSFTLPTRIDRLNKISLLAKDFVYDIFPRVESHVNFNAEIKSEESKTIRGTIDWTRTILNSLNRGEKQPLQFTCITSETKFDTPENLLSIFCILKLQNDVEYLLYSKDLKNYELNFREIFILTNLKQKIDNLLAHTNLRELIPKLILYKSLSFNSKLIQNLEQKTIERIRQGIIKQKSYYDIIDWIKKYRGYNIRALTEQFTNFPIEHERSIDTMYELWIIFEMVTYFVEKKQVKFLRSLERDGKFAGFQLQLDQTMFNLNYQGKRQGWTGYESQPDFTIQVAGTDNIPIVMDPKNWSSSQTGEAIHKMLGYLSNLSQYNASIGILFFSHPIGTHLQDNANPLPYVISSQKVHGKELTFITMLINPNSLENLEINLEIVYQNLQNQCRNA